MKVSPLVVSLAAASVLAASLVASGASNAHAAAVPNAAVKLVAEDKGVVMSVPYGDELLLVKGLGTKDASWVKLSFYDWRNLGYPKPTPAPVDFVKYPWMDDIMAVSFFGPNRDNWKWGYMSLKKWQRAGQPTPRTAGWIWGSTYRMYASNEDEVFVESNGITHKLTYQEWLDAGAPYPQRNPAEMAKLTWSDSVAYVHDEGAERYSFLAWQLADFPTPKTYRRMAGDRFIRSACSNDIYYVGPTFTGKISFSQWLAAGSPAPEVRSECRMPILWQSPLNTGSQPTRENFLMAVSALEDLENSKNSMR